jgi:plastocyanin
MRLFIFIFLISLNVFSEEVVSREVSIIVTKEGYYPKSITVFKGEKVKFYVTSTTDEADCFILQGHKVFLAATKGKVTEAETVFTNDGVFNFYCPSHKNDGKILVLKKSGSRDIASEGDVWKPKEY